MHNFSLPGYSENAFEYFGYVFDLHTWFRKKSVGEFLPNEYFQKLFFQPLRSFYTILGSSFEYIFCRVILNFKQKQYSHESINIFIKYFPSTFQLKM
jgi:hypothetical protein